MTRLILVVLVGLINLGLGFTTAVYFGRGPWSRCARQRGTAKSRGRQISEPVADSPLVSMSIEQIAAELEQAEQRFLSLLDLDSAEPRPAVSAAELLAAVQAGLDQFSALVPQGDLSGETRLQVLQGIATLQSVLKSASDALQRPESDEAPPPDPNLLAENLMTSCQEARGAFTALLFAGPTA